MRAFMEKVVILGTGIAGLTAAIYAARASLAPLVIGGPQEGGQLTLTTDVENFPCFPDGVQGPEMVQLARKQAEKFGTRYKTGIVNDCTKIDGGYELSIGEEKIQTQTLILATGASARWMGIPTEEQYKGRGVTTCATCDGFFYKGKEVMVIGGGDSACEEALFLTKFASKVTIIHRRDTLRASKIMQDRALNHDKISIMWDSQVSEVLGDGKKVTGVKISNTKTNTVTEHPIDGIFVAIGHIPNTSFLKGKIELDEKGYLQTNRFMHTNLPGVFGAGDVQDIVYRQAITAAGTGCQAAIEAEKYLSEHTK
jgi:thioredoxin reductase (NADPH)